MNVLHQTLKRTLLTLELVGFDHQVCGWIVFFLCFFTTRERVAGSPAAFAIAGKIFEKRFEFF